MMALPEKTYEIIFKRRDKDPDEVLQCTGLSEAREIMGLFTDPISAELYERIVLIEHDWPRKIRRVCDVTDFQPCDVRRDWRKRSAGRRTGYG